MRSVSWKFLHLFHKYWKFCFLDFAYMLVVLLLVYFIYIFSFCSFYHRSGLQTLRNLRVTHLHIWSQQQLCYHLTWKWVVFGIVCIGDCEDVFCYYCPYHILTKLTTAPLLFFIASSFSAVLLISLAVWLSFFQVFLPMPNRCLSEC